MASSAPRSYVPFVASYLSLPDTDTVACAQMGDRRAAERLICKYRSLVISAARRFYLPGADHDDIMQIGMIGLWQAIVDFRVDRSASFPAFARLCIRRHLLSALKSARRLKRTALNTAISLDTATSDFRRSKPDRCDTVTIGDPEAAVITDDEVHTLRGFLRGVLSDFEWQVLVCLESGMSYHEIAARLDCKVKSVDNALSRARRKASYAYAKRSFAATPMVDRS